jgi:transposase InsO family protein
MSGAHLGIDAVFEKARERYYWPQMYDDIRDYVETCDICQKRGSQKRKEELIPLTIRDPFYRIGIDIKGPLPRTSKGNRYIIVAMDYFTKWPEAKAIADIKAGTVAKFIYEEIICRHGVPKEILSDRGTSFVNQVIDELCKNFQTKHRLTSPYRPQTNGMVERFNRTLGECIAKLASSEDKEWDNFVDAILFAYRTKKHKTTGFTPFYLIYGRQATLPIELKIPGVEETDSEQNPLAARLYHLIEQLENDRQIVRDRVTQEQLRQKERHDQAGLSEKLKIGDKVLVEKSWLRTNFSAKLEDKWIGPYYIHNVLKDNVYKLRTLEGRLVKNLVHGNRLKLYKERLLEPIVLV